MTKCIEDVTFRSISMDGGGLYGLATAIMLGKLCRGDCRFLSDDPKYKVSMFTGTSAGALNALLLGTTDNPRQFILDGGLEKFWRNGWDIFANKNPVTATLSWFGLTAWLGSQDFLNYLHRYFGDRTLESLPGNVMVCTFDWYGNASDSSDSRMWTPRIFTNLSVGTDDDPGTYGHHYKIKDIAYGAASPPPYRATINGLGDATIVANNPSMMTYSFIKSHFPAAPQAILSVGMCLKNPSYGFEAFNFGALPFCTLPTNLCQENFCAPPLQVWVTGVSETASLNAKQILGPFYHRLNPPVLGPPNPSPNSAIQMCLARFLPWFQWLLNAIDQATATPVANEAARTTLAFLDSVWWSKGEAEHWSEDKTAMSLSCLENESEEA